MQTKMWRYKSEGEPQTGKANNWSWKTQRGTVLNWTDLSPKKGWGPFSILTFSFFHFFFLSQGKRGPLFLAPITSLREGLGITSAYDQRVEVRPRRGKLLFQNQVVPVGSEQPLPKK